MEKKLYTLENKNGMKAYILNYGAILQGLEVPDKDGNRKDVVLGYDDLDQYEKNNCFFGCTVGPIANRTAYAVYRLDGLQYQLDPNENENNLHSSMEDGYHKQYFSVEEKPGAVICTLQANDGELGSPGNKEIKVTYSLSEDNGLSIHYEVTSDKNTWINLTNHSYFNLAGHDSGVIDDHYLVIHANSITAVRDGSIPTGELLSVEGTPMDFRTSTRIMERIKEPFEQLLLTSGYDHNYCLENASGGQRVVATFEDKKAGRIMDVLTDLPGGQLYSGNFIKDEQGKNKAQYGKNHGVCFETQYYPNAINESSFLSPITGPDAKYETTTIYRFR